ncbi:MAG: sigma-70 family RNA polymerase sigma factor [Bacteroidota bacterium]
MAVSTSLPITALLHDAREGHPEAIDAIFPLVYEQLRLIAHRQMQGERFDHTLSTTGLVHEAYLKFADLNAVDWQDRAHFFALAARAMRQILIDHARTRNAQKRQGQHPHVPLDSAVVMADRRADELLALDEALAELESWNPRMAQVVECRFFGGYTQEETARILGVTDRTVRREWTRAKVYLYRAMHPDVATSDG